jgi:hypothetical protein
MGLNTVAAAAAAAAAATTDMPLAQPPLASPDNCPSIALNRREIIGVGDFNTQNMSG